MKNKKLLVALALVLVLTVTMVSAYMRKQTQTENNTFTPATVSCRVDETFENNQKTNITVTNTGNYKAYIRVRLVTYWQKDDGSVVYKKSGNIPAFDYDESNWLVDQNENTYYYVLPVDPGATVTLLPSGKYMTLTKDGNNYHQVVDVFAEAILAETVDTNTGPIADVESAWNVTVNTASGKITKIN